MTDEHDQLRQPPHDFDAEKCVLCALVNAQRDDEPTVARIRRTLSGVGGVKAFYLPEHGYVYAAACDLRDAGKLADANCVRAELKRRGQWGDGFGMEQMAEVILAMPGVSTGVHYAELVREAAVWRAGIGEATRLIDAAYLPHKLDKAADTVARSASRFARIAAAGIVADAKTVGVAADEVIAELRSGKPRRLPTGLFAFDQLTGGLPIGRFTQIAGRPGMGKSLLVKQIGRNLAKSGVPFGLVTVEETSTKVGENALSAVSGIENYKIAFNRDLGDHQITMLEDAADDLHRYPFYIFDQPVRLGEVAAAVTSLALEHKCQVVAVDYLQMIDAGIDNENREVTLISRTLKGLFKQLRVAGLAAVQLNRGNEQGSVQRPVLKNLRGSGTLEQDGDLIVLLHREDYYKRDEPGYQYTNQLDALVEKNKDGPTGAVPLHFDAATQRITDWQAPIPEFFT